MTSSSPAPEQERQTIAELKDEIIQLEGKILDLEDELRTARIRKAVLNGNLADRILEDAAQP